MSEEEDDWFEGDFCVYTVADLSKSPQDVLEIIGKGFASMQRDAEFKGGIAFRIAVQADAAELVEEAAKRGGMQLIRMPDDEEGSF